MSEGEFDLTGFREQSLGLSQEKKSHEDFRQREDKMSKNFAETGEVDIVQDLSSKIMGFEVDWRTLRKDQGLSKEEAIQLAKNQFENYVDQNRNLIDSLDETAIRNIQEKAEVVGLSILPKEEEKQAA